MVDQARPLIRNTSAAPAQPSTKPASFFSSLAEPRWASKVPFWLPRASLRHFRRTGKGVVIDTSTVAMALHIPNRWLLARQAKRLVGNSGKHRPPNQVNKTMSEEKAEAALAAAHEQAVRGTRSLESSGMMRHSFQAVQSSAVQAVLVKRCEQDFLPLKTERDLDRHRRRVLASTLFLDCAMGMCAFVL